MTKGMIVNELVRMSIDLDFIDGHVPEDATRMAVSEILLSLGRLVREKNYVLFFPMEFPMQMTLESEQLQWNFRIVARLKNALANAEEENE